jgi:hypothetical protein
MGTLNIAVHRVSRSQSPIKQHPMRRLHSHVIANQESRKRMECLLWWHHVWQSNSASALYRMPTGRSSSSETACVQQAGSGTCTLSTITQLDSNAKITTEEGKKASDESHGHQDLPPTQCVPVGTFWKSLHFQDLPPIPGLS